MKKNIYLLTIITLIGVLNAKAQEDVIYGGFKVAPNYSIFTEKVSDNWKSGIGFNIGYFEVLELKKRINLQAEVNLNSTKFLKEISSNGYSSKITNTNINIILPLMVKYRLSNELALGLGYQFSLDFLMKSKLTEKIKNSGPGYSNEEKINSDGLPNNGFFFDASYSKGKHIFGFRLLSPMNPQIEDYSTINISFSYGYKLF